MPSSTARKNAFLDVDFGSGTPATWYLGLLEGLPVSADGSGYAEPAGSSYARQAITNNATNFPAASGGEQPIDVATAFPAADVQWDIVGVGLFTASTGGNCQYWQSYTKTVPIGGIISFASSAIVLK